MLAHLCQILCNFWHFSWIKYSIRGYSLYRARLILTVTTTVVLSIFLLGEQLSWQIVLGALSIACSIVLVTWLKRRGYQETSRVSSRKQIEQRADEDTQVSEGKSAK